MLKRLYESFSEEVTNDKGEWMRCIHVLLSLFTIIEIKISGSLGQMLLFYFILFDQRQPSERLTRQ